MQRNKQRPEIIFQHLLTSDANQNKKGKHCFQHNTKLKQENPS